jgi:soluble lytic murein transglycosylase
MEDYRTEDLFRPAVSLQFGAYYIGGQLKRYGTPQAALAAYNAGPGRLQQWLAGAPDGDLADFVEAVDINETHNYVILVLEQYAYYQAAWADPG